MDISIVYEDGSENEFDLPLCCASCSSSSYGLSLIQHEKVKALIDKGTALKVPDDTTTLQKLVAFIKTL